MPLSLQLQCRMTMAWGQHCRCPLSSRRSSCLSGSRLQAQPTSLRPRPSSRQLLHVEAFKVGEFKWWEQKAAPNFVHVTSAKDLADQLEYCKERLVILDVYAKWCVACRALYPELVKLALKNPDIVFLCLDYDDHKDLCKAMGVKQIPFFQLFNKEGRVANFSIGVSKLWLLKDAIAKYKPKNMSPFEPLGKEDSAAQPAAVAQQAQPVQQQEQQLGGSAVAAQPAVVAEGMAAVRTGVSE